jgi:hypothetical protein
LIFDQSHSWRGITRGSDEQAQARLERTATLASAPVYQWCGFRTEFTSADARNDANYGRVHRIIRSYEDTVPQGILSREDLLSERFVHHDVVWRPAGVTCIEKTAVMQRDTKRSKEITAHDGYASLRLLCNR